LQWKNLVLDKSKEISLLEQKIKEQKVTAKQKEIELSGLEEQTAKLEKKKDILKNEKELTALNHEVSKVSSDKDALEIELIELFDLIAKDEAGVSELKSGFVNIEKQTEQDIKGLEEQIAAFQKSSEENQQQFETLTDQLSSEVKSKFLKLTKSPNGKAIAVIDGENCSGCNFQIPFYLIQDVLNENKIINCTNCGRFLYNQK
jgi:uncharacterized protein